MTDERVNVVRKFLQRIANEENYENPIIEATAVPNTGANFTSQLFNVTIKSKGKDDLKLFAKAAVLSETTREEAGELFNIEHFFYTDLLKKIQALEDGHNVPKEHRLTVGKYYGYNNIYLHEVMLFEDLSKQGFKTLDRQESIDWDYASKAVEQLAKFHALSIALQSEHPSYYKNAINVFDGVKFLKEGGIFDKFFVHFKSQMISMVDEKYREKIKEVFETHSGLNHFTKLAKSKRRPVIIHSDYRQGNIMHKVDEDGKLQQVILDFQTLCEGSVAVDLLYFIFLGSDAKFRAQYYHQLIEHYYENLAAALKRLHLDPEEAFPRADFDEELTELLPIGLIMAGVILPLITVDLSGLANTKDGAFENTSTAAVTNIMGVGNDVCVKKLNELARDYMNWGFV